MPASLASELFSGPVLCSWASMEPPLHPGGWVSALCRALPHPGSSREGFLPRSPAPSHQLTLGGAAEIEGSPLSGFLLFCSLVNSPTRCQRRGDRRWPLPGHRSPLPPSPQRGTFCPTSASKAPQEVFPKTKQVPPRIALIDRVILVFITLLLTTEPFIRDQSPRGLIGALRRSMRTGHRQEEGATPGGALDLTLRTVASAP
ncbi:PREDICTED: uncharacterized protein LOC106724484 [Myotis brandtii]|uniref:uncharacterized protein LOC106724484 n=1 Tax=Myotis brandtii TaxID=109478 RepID=UPI000703D1BA|nr:PREDICTED: uncharacterized protein LOC106724484 [Myotis brandtii]